MIKCYGFPLTNVFRLDISVCQTSKRDAFCDTTKATKSISGPDPLVGWRGKTLPSPFFTLSTS